MVMESVTLKLHQEMRRQTATIARERDITVGQLMRNLIADKINRHRKARPPVRADEQLIAPLRAHLAPDLAEAPTWEDLQNRLKSRGYILRVAGGGLALHEHPSDVRICKASELGFSYSKIMHRLRAPFPGHPHHWVFERSQSSNLKEPVTDGDDLQVIERF